MLVGLTSIGEFGFAPGGIREHMNFLDGHIEAVAHYLGLEERQFVHVEYQEFGDDRHTRSHKDGETNTVALAETLARTFPPERKWRNGYSAALAPPPPRGMTETRSA